MSDAPIPDLTELKVTLWNPDQEPLQGEILDATFQKVCVRVPVRPEAFELETRLLLHLESPNLDAPVKAVALVRHSAVYEGGCQVQLEIQDWIGLRQQLPPPLRRLFNLRDGMRFRPTEERPIEVDVNCRGRGLFGVGTLVDLSLSGLSVRVGPKVGARLHLGELMTARFTIPGQEEAAEMTCLLRHSRRQEDGWNLGLVFDPVQTPHLVHHQLAILRLFH